MLHRNDYFSVSARDSSERQQLLLFLSILLQKLFGATMNDNFKVSFFLEKQLLKCGVFGALLIFGFYYGSKTLNLLCNLLLSKMKS